ncbi:hypothetical protein [Sphingomonas sp. CCH13-B11]|jgi:hypothetical protein|uniref:hypothetical protein n=1 Tax=Sphingomonas sp. CCH13-B11 TaxID=1768791 RepID=UPI00082EAD79|nr:hypothetical protein [Sphingomonas sp. CCH13-B11]
MNGHFSVDVDPARRLIKVKMGGFFSLDDVAGYHDAVHRATARAGGLPSQQRMICDISDMRIQTQDVVDAFRRVMGDPKYRQRKVGFVVASSLARMQLLRVIGSRNAQCFATEAEAEDWVFQVEDSVSAA